MSIWNGNYQAPLWSGTNSITSGINSSNIKISSIQVNYISSGLIQSGILSTLTLNVSSINGSNITEYSNSNWSKYPAIQDVNISNYNINNIATTNTNAIVVGNGGQLWNGNAQFNGTGNLFSPYWYNFTMDANITTGQANQQYPPTNSQYFSQYDVYHNSFDAESLTNNLTFNNAHLGINAQSVAVLPVGNVILESKNYKLNLPFVEPPISYLAGTYRGSAYLGVNGTGPSAYIRMNYDSLGNYIPDNSALVEINADSVTGVTPLASSRVRTTAGKCDMLGTYGATMTAGTFINPLIPDLNSNYTAVANFNLYAYSIIGIPDPFTLNAGEANLTVTGSNHVTSDTYGNAIINITATRANTNTFGYNANINLNANDHIYLNTYRAHFATAEVYMSGNLIGSNDFNINNVDSIQVSNLYNSGGINVFNDLYMNNNNISDVNNFNASNILINDSNTFSNSFNTTYNGIPVLPSQAVSSFNIFNTTSNINNFQATIPNAIITSSNTTVQVIDGVTYNVFDATGTTYYNGILSNTFFDISPTLITFGTASQSEDTFCDFYNNSSLPLYITPQYPVSYTGFASISASNSERGYFIGANSNIAFIPLSNINPPLYPSTIITSVYNQYLSFTQNVSSAVLQVDISGYDTNSNIISGLGNFEIKANNFTTDTIYTNYISAGNIVGGIPFSNDNITVNSISTNLISTNVLQANQIIFDNNGTAGLSTFSNFYRGYGGLLALSNADFYLNKQNIVGVNIGDFETLSTISITASAGIFSTISTNNLTVINLENVSSISTNKLSVSYIENLSSLVANSVQASKLSSQTLYTSTGLFNGYVSTQTANIYYANIYQLSNNTDTRIRLAQSFLPTNSNTLTLGTTTVFFNTTYTNNVVSVSNITSTISVSSINSINPNNILNIGGLTIGNSGISTNTISSISLFVSSIQVNNISAGNIIGSVSQSNITSSLIGLGSLGYISSTQLTSTVQGLGNIYLSSINSEQPSITSSIIGLGTLGYVSSTQLTSTVRGLGNIYVSTPSLISTITGWSGIPANKNVNMGNHNISNVQALYTDVINPNTFSFVNFPTGGIATQNIYAEPLGEVIYMKDSVVFQSNVVFENTIDLSSNDISGVNNIYFSEAIGDELFINVIKPNTFDYVKVEGRLDLSNNNISNVNQVITNSLILVDTVDGYTTTFSNYEYGAVFDTNSSQFSFTNSGGTESAVIQVEYAGIAGGFLYIDITGSFHLSNSSGSIIADGILVASQSLNVDYIYTNSNSAVQFPTNSIDMNGNSISNINQLEFNDADTIDVGTIILSNGYFSYTSLLSPSTFIPIASDWWNFGANSDINLNYNSIDNVNNITVDVINPNSNRSIAITGNGLQVDYLTTYLNHYIEVDSDFDVLGSLSSDSIEPYSSNGINFNQTILSNFTQLIFTSNTNVGSFLIGDNSRRAGALISLSNADFNFANQNIYNGGDYTGASISTTQISTSIITTSAIYTQNLGNNNPYAVESIIVNNALNMSQNNISNANTFTMSNLSTIQISTGTLCTSSITVSSINKVAFPLIQFGIATVNTTVTLSNHYSNSNYSVLLTYRGGGGGGVLPLYTSNITASNFYVGGTIGSNQCFWQTIGF